MSNLSVKTIVAIGIGSALFFLLARFVSIVVFVNTTVNFQYALLSFFAVIFGPIAGVLIGFIGHALADLAWGWGLWWSWIIVSGIVGCAFGFIMKGVDVEAGEFATAKPIIRFVVATTVTHLVAWGLIAPVLDIIIYQQPANLVFTQGLVASIPNIVTTAIIGSVLLFGYSKTRARTGSLSKDE